ncbi:accessory Sec system S-layer assembly protein [Lentibacillus saliphilus]|uniref:accessory Sec system S-layer assembly protein n=1 Tax=Lentibacillus saliphilus TaxID=2737028 RepID=UPI001C308B2C|nr:accessory Sec system S-layer assembly protein [Lentibacillus saliphilus]
MSDNHNDHHKREDEATTELYIPDHDPIGRDAYAYYALHNAKSPSMKKDQLSIYGIELSKQSDSSFIASALIRSTIHKPVRLKSSPIVLLGAEGRAIARTVVDFTELGVLRPNTSRPWQFEFPKASILVPGTPDLQNWSLAFEKDTEHKLDMEDMERAGISEVSRAKLRKIVEQAPLLDRNELSFMGLGIKRNESGGLTSTILIRNGTMQDLQITQVPLVVHDATGDIVARGTFELSDFNIKANTSKPVTLVFPKSGIVKEHIDLSMWSIKAIE